MLSLATVLVLAATAAPATKPDSDAPWKIEAAHGATKTVAFTTDEGTWLSLDVHPDGSRIVFSLLGDLYLLPIAGGKATRITEGTAYDVQPRFSPDGKSIAFRGGLRRPLRDGRGWQEPAATDPEQRDAAGGSLRGLSSHLGARREQARVRLRLRRPLRRGRRRTGFASPGRERAQPGLVASRLQDCLCAGRRDGPALAPT